MVQKVRVLKQFHEVAEDYLGDNDMASNPISHHSGNPKKRRRPAMSCEQCRDRKVKCDLQEPCGPCVRTRASLTCTYSPHTVRNGNTADGRKTKPSDRPCLSFAQGRLTDQREQSPVNSGDSFVHLRTPASTTDLSEQCALESQSQMQHLDGIPSAVLQSSQLGPWSSAKPREGSRAGQPIHVHSGIVQGRQRGCSSLSVTPPSPLLRLTHSKTRIFNQTHWSHTATKFHVLGQLNHKGPDMLPHSEKTELRNSIEGLGQMRQAIKHQQRVSLNDPVPNLISTFPTKAICDDLVSAYFRTFEVMYRTLHVPSFSLDYEKFCDSPQSSSTVFSTKLALVFAIGTTFHPTEPDRKDLRRSAQTWIYAAQWWLTGPSEKSANNIDGVQVACLLLLARQVTAVGLANCPCPDIALRLAMSIGLHRDPDHFPALSAFQAQMRRRLWYSALELTNQALFNLSMPLTISREHYDTKLPLNLDDDDFTAESEVVTEAIPDDQVTDHSLQRLMLGSLALRMRVAKMLNGIGQQLDYDLAIKLGDELKSVCREIVTFVDAVQSQQLGRTLQVSSFHAEYLDISFRHYILLLHRPFVLQARNNPQFYYSRKICLESAMVTSSYARNLELPSEPTHDLARLLMVAKGPVSGPLSLDVIMTLCLELLTQLEEDGTDPAAANDAANVLAKVSREPVFQALEHIREQVLQIIGLGSPSLKRYGYLSAILSQFRAMERGGDVLPNVLASIKEQMMYKRTLMGSAIEGFSARDSIESLIRASTSAKHTPAELGLDDFLGQGDLDLDTTDLFHFPEMTFGGMMEW